jgi:hypothetical protein
MGMAGVNDRVAICGPFGSWASIKCSIHTLAPTTTTQSRFFAESLHRYNSGSVILWDPWPRVMLLEFHDTDSELAVHTSESCVLLACEMGLLTPYATLALCSSKQCQHGLRIFLLGRWIVLVSQNEWKQRVAFAVAAIDWCKAANPRCRVGGTGAGQGGAALPQSPSTIISISGPV